VYSSVSCTGAEVGTGCTAAGSELPRTRLLLVCTCGGGGGGAAER
jgi:hypothetical protein